MADKETKKEKTTKAGSDKKAQKADKEKKPNIFKRMGKGIASFFKNFRAELKKIIWPTGKSVLRNTAVVLFMVVAVGVVIYLIDLGLTQSIALIKSLADKTDAAAINALILK